MRFRGSRYRGQTVVLMGVMMVALVGMMSLAVDAGIILVIRRELRNAADAAALAGVSKLPGDPPLNAVTVGEAEDLADEYVAANLGSGSPVDRLCEGTIPAAEITTGTEPVGTGVVYTLTVTVRCTGAWLAFGRILNLLPMPVVGSATAAMGTARAADCPLPLAVEAKPGGTFANGWGYNLGELVSLTVDVAGSGNANWIQAGAPGAATVYDAVGGNCSATFAPEVGQPVTTEPGVLAAPVIANELDARTPDPGLDDCPPGPPPPLGWPALCSDPILQAALGTPGPPTAPLVACRPIITLDSTSPNYLMPLIEERPPGSGNFEIAMNSGCFGVVVMVDSTAFQGSSTANVEGTAIFTILGFAFDGSNKRIVGAFVTGTILSEIGAYNELGAKVIRLIR